MSKSYNKEFKNISRIKVKINVPSYNYKVDLHKNIERLDLVETSGEEDSDIGHQSSNIKINANHKNHTHHHHHRHNKKKRKREPSNAKKHGDKLHRNKKRKTEHEYDHQNTSYPNKNENKDAPKNQMQRTAGKVCDAFGLKSHFRRDKFIKNMAKC